MGKKKSERHGSTANPSSNSRTKTIPPKDNEDKYVILAVIVIALFAVIYQTSQNHLLKKYGEYTNAVIYEFTKGGKRGRHKTFLYNYVVDDVKYKGWGEWDHRRDTLSIGDTVIIMYNKKKPSHSRTKRDLKL